MARSASQVLTRRLSLERLEDRRMLADFTVSNLGDAPVSAPGDAPGTLRQAIFDANSLPGPDVIRFSAGLSGAIDLAASDDQDGGPSALVVSSEITIQGNVAGITIRRDAAAAEMRLFRVLSSGSLTLDSISLAGGVARGPSDGAGRGGAVYNEGSLEVRASTIYDNAAIGGNAYAGPDGGPGLGGAIYSDGGDVVLVNTTVSGNAAQSGTGASALSSLGGGVYGRNGSLAIYNSTITNHSASTGRGVYVVGVGAGYTATVAIYSSIIGQADIPSFARDFIATFDDGGDVAVSGANNLIRSQTSYHEITISTADPLLGALADHGGPTLTHDLTDDCPAVDLGSNPQTLLTDQRGPSYARVIGGQVDIGAFELQTLTGPALPGDYNGNAVVDAADYVLWRKTFGVSVPAWSAADGSGNGQIDAEDYSVWRAGFGSTTAGAAVGAASERAEHETRPIVAFDAFHFSRSRENSPKRLVQVEMSSVAGSAQDDAILAVLAARYIDPARPDVANGVELHPAIAESESELIEEDFISFASFS